MVVFRAKHPSSFQGSRADSKLGRCTNKCTNAEAVTYLSTVSSTVRKRVVVADWLGVNSGVDAVLY